MKLRSRTLEDAPESAPSPKKIRIQKPDDFEVVHPGSVTSYGEFGKCDGSECDGVPEETMKIDNGRLCRTCAKKTHVDLLTQNGNFEDSDAEFKCPVFSTEGSCKSERITFWQFYVGACCEKASKWLTENEKAQKKKLHVVKNMKEETKRDKIEAEEESEKIRKKIESLESLQANRRSLVEKTLKSIQETDKELEEKKKAQGTAEETLRKRNLAMDKVSMRYKQLSYEYHALTNRHDDEGDDESSGTTICRVCLEKYGDNFARRKYALTRCGHVACRSCFDQILAGERYDGNCPHCRSYFDVDEMIRIHE